MLEDFLIKEIEKSGKRPELTFVQEHWTKEGEKEETKITTDEYAIDLVKTAPHNLPVVRVELYDERKSMGYSSSVDFELLYFLTHYIPLLKGEEK